MSNITDAQIDMRRERKFRSIIRKALGQAEEVADILVTTEGLIITLKSGEQFMIWVQNRTGRS